MLFLNSIKLVFSSVYSDSTGYIMWLIIYYENYKIAWNLLHLHKTIILNHKY